MYYMGYIFFLSSNLPIMIHAYIDGQSHKPMLLKVLLGFYRDKILFNCDEVFQIFLPLYLGSCILHFGVITET